MFFVFLRARKVIGAIKENAEVVETWGVEARKIKGGPPPTNYELDKL